MQLSKIWLFDNVIIGNNHLAINSGIFNIAQEMLSAESPHNEICMFGEKSHIQIISTLVDNKKEVVRRFTPIEVIAPKAGTIKRIWSWQRKLRKDRSEFNNLISSAAIQRPDIIILNTLIANNFLYFFKKIKKHHYLKFLLVLHGEIEHIFNPSANCKDKIKAYNYTKSFKRKPSNLKLITLNNYSKEQLLKHNYLQKDEVISIKHPLPSRRLNSRTLLGTEEINMLHLGVANKRKNSRVIFDMAGNINDKIKLTILGRLENSILEYKNDKVFIAAKENHPIPQSQYEQFIKKAHYSLSFIQGKEYTYRVSGSLLDSVIYQLPIIALRHTAVEELFAIGGNIGFLCNTKEEMISFINKIAQDEGELRSQYNAQVHNLGLMSHYFSAKFIAEGLIPFLDC